MTRGLRNNNPGNIRHGPSQWKGMAPVQSDPAFVQFVDAPAGYVKGAYGIRAMQVLLENYIGEGFNTIRKIVTHYAPPSENVTTSYVANVSARAGIAPDKLVSPSDVPAISAAMMYHENGMNVASIAEIVKARGIA